jgi:hypothetical protein
MNPYSHILDILDRSRHFFCNLKTFHKFRAPLPEQLKTESLDSWTLCIVRNYESPRDRLAHSWDRTIRLNERRSFRTRVLTHDDGH